MALLESTLVSLCVSANPTVAQACTNAVQAGGKQTGVFEIVNKYEDNQILVVKNGVVSYLGKNTSEMVGGTVWIAKSLADKSATLKLPNLGFCNDVTAQIGQDKSLLTFKWKL